MFYYIFKYIFRLATWVFFSDIHIRNREALPQKGPLLVVANHPSTFMDPIVAGMFLKQRIYFIAKGSLFDTPFKSWVLRKMGVIPVYRKQDSSGEMNKNDSIFERCYDYLGKKSTIMIFPEGTSINERRLRKIKTGTARIALGAEAQHDFKLGVKIATVGLNYSNPRQFRSELYINVDNPIAVSDYASDYQKDEFQTVRDLTERIRQRLEAHIVVTEDDEDDELVKNIETLYMNRLIDELDLAEERKEEEFLIQKGLIAAIEYCERTDPDRIVLMKQKIDAYFDKLKRLALNDKLLASTRKTGSIVRKSLKRMLYTILGLPVHLYGLLNNYIPYILPSKIANLITKHDEYIGPIMMTVGIFSFPLFYGLQMYGVHQLFGNGWLTALYGLSLPLTGFFVLHYWRRIQITRDYWKLFAIFYKRNTVISGLIEQRKEIMDMLEKAKEDYVAVVQARSTSI